MSKSFTLFLFISEYHDDDVEDADDDEGDPQGQPADPAGFEPRDRGHVILRAREE